MEHCFLGDRNSNVDNALKCFKQLLFSEVAVERIKVAEKYRAKQSVGRSNKEKGEETTLCAGWG